MSKVLPILFNTDMVRAILDGRKTVTRRLAKKIPIETHRIERIESEDGKLKFECHWGGYIPDVPGFVDGVAVIEAPYQPEDILYVRETWRVGAWDIRNQMIAFDYKDGTCGELTYIHDRELFERLVNQSREDAKKAKCEYNGVDFIWEKGKSPCRWHPSIHMPKAAARIWLKVKDVRVEQLQDMNEVDTAKEGIRTDVQTCRLDDPDFIENFGGIELFKDLWNSTIKKSDLDRYGWDASPWVWVIEFERCEKPEVWCL